MKTLLDMLGWALFKHLVKSVINQRLIETDLNVHYFTVSFTIFFLAIVRVTQDQDFKVFSSKGQLLLPPVILFDFLKMSQSFSARIWCRLSLFSELHSARQKNILLHRQSKSAQ